MKKVDDYNKCNNYLKITGIINYMATENFKENKNKILQYTSSSSFVTRKWKLDH